MQTNILFGKVVIIPALLASFCTKIKYTRRDSHIVMPSAEPQTSPTLSGCTIQLRILTVGQKKCRTEKTYLILNPTF